MREQQPGLGFQASGDRRDQGPSSAGAEEKQTSTLIISKPRGKEAGASTVTTTRLARGHDDVSRCIRYSIRRLPGLLRAEGVPNYVSDLPTHRGSGERATNSGFADPNNRNGD